MATRGRLVRQQKPSLELDGGRKERVNITIDPGLLARVRELAEENSRSFSGQIVYMLRTFIEEHGA